MKYALIGCGRIATNHVKAVLNNKLEFVAACDIMPENIGNRIIILYSSDSNFQLVKINDDLKKMILEKQFI